MNCKCCYTFKYCVNRNTLVEPYVTRNMTKVENA